jgi:hypothetical protein
MYVMRRRVVLAALLAVGVVGIVPTAQAKPPAEAGPASIALSVAQGLPVAAAGKHMLYTDTGINVGKGTATQVTLTHPTPGATADRAIVVEGSGTCSIAPLLVTCKLGNLKSLQRFKVDVLTPVPTTLGPTNFEVRVTTNELGNDNPGTDPKQDTFTAQVSTQVRAVSNDFNGDCFITAPESPLTTDNSNIGATAANPVVTILQFTTIAGLTATCVSLDEVPDPQNTGRACPTGVTCFMPQFSEALFPLPPHGQTVTIQLIIDVSVMPLPTVFYADRVLVPDCPVTSGICNVKPFVTLPSGDLVVTFNVTTDIRLRG